MTTTEATPAALAADERFAPLPGILRASKVEWIDKYGRTRDWTDDQVERELEYEMGRRGIRVTAFRDLVAAKLGLSRNEAKDLCESAVAAGVLDKIGGGSSVAYADAATRRTLADREAELGARREAVVARLADAGVATHEGRTYGRPDGSIRLSLVDAEALAARLAP